MADMSVGGGAEGEMPDPFPYLYAHAGSPLPPPDPPPPRRRRYTKRITVAAVLVVAFAAGAVVTGRISYAEATRKPTAAELSAAAEAGLAQRWERISAGTLFPASVAYTTSEGTKEAASRIGIGPATSCAAAVDQTLTGLAARYRCDGAMRATYVDGLDGAVYTVGVLAFPTQNAAYGFDSSMPATSFPATGLHALAFDGTAAARFDDAARQLSQAELTGPYVVLVVAGYADGRPASATGEQRPDAFGPATQIADAVYAPLNAPEVVNCQVKSEWSC
jgi:hypothetical protein